HEVHELDAHGVALAAALDGGDADLGRHRLAIVPFQPVAQGEGPHRLVGRHVVLFDHLRLDRVVLVHREQRVVDQVAVVARDVGRRPDRIKDRQVAVLHEAQDLALRPGGPGVDRQPCTQNRAGGRRRESAPHDLHESFSNCFVSLCGRAAPFCPAASSVYFFDTFQNTGTGAIRLPSTALRRANGWYHWPRLTWVGLSTQYFCRFSTISFCL